MNRHIDFEGIENFRDFGGYDTACGRGLKRGVLYRSANHARATDADLEALKALGVSVIVDLRRPIERQREPSRRWADFAGQVIENDIDGGYQDWADALKEVAAIGPDWFRQDGLSFYHKAPYEPRHLDLFARYFRALAETDGAVVVHCAAGKDRTGMLCAFTQHLAGVHRDDILADYLLTNDEVRILRRMETFGPWLRDLTGQVIADEALRAALSVAPEYLEQAFARIEAEHGGLDRYLDEALGLDSDLRERLEARLLG
ncbi:MAG: tyrosine-protein phosphatase [Phenylobacterium sp.]|uniref:tyrosine-protein phosphatase n=1 Tax=Phenylobacterium sp. TaxID=1871053 RepID=UPI00391D74B2